MAAEAAAMFAGAHPAFIRGAVPCLIDASKLEAYKAALLRQDWWYEFCDDVELYRKGRDSWIALRAMRKELDPAGVLWNQHAPRRYQVGQGLES